MSESAPCPYCNDALAPIPKRKKKCPYCGNLIFVRSGQLWTSTQVEEEELIRRYWRPYVPLGLSQDLHERNVGQFRYLFEVERKKLSEEFGHLASVADTMWRMLNTTSVETRDENKRALCYVTMAQIAGDEGRDPSRFLELSGQIYGQRLARQADALRKTAKHVEIFTANDEFVCENCRRWADREIPVEEAVLLLEVQHRCTSLGGCRCNVVPGETDFD